MLQRFVVYLFRKLVPWVEKTLDPELKKRLDAIDAKVAASDARAREAQAKQLEREKEYAESARRTLELDLKLAESRRQQELAELELSESRKRQEEIRNEIEKLKDAVDDRTDDVAIFGGVPKSGRSPADRTRD